MTRNIEDRVKALHERRNFKVRAVRNGQSVQLHITDDSASRWLDLTVDETCELVDELQKALDD